MNCLGPWAAGGALSRRQFLGLTAGAGLAVALNACQPAPQQQPAGKKHLPLEQEPGRLLLFEWAGYEVPHLYSSYLNADYAKPKFSFFSSDDEALSKVRAGFTPDVVHPCGGYLTDWFNLGVIQPWDTSLLVNFKDLNPFMVKAGQIDGQQFLIPTDFGFTAPLYRSDEVNPEGNSINVLFDARYGGKISWWDGIWALYDAGLVLGVADPWNMSDQELQKVKSFLIEKKDLVRNFWVAPSDVNPDIVEGNVLVVGEAWAASYLAMQRRGIPVVFMQPDEGRISALCGLVLMKDTTNFYHAHKFADAWLSSQTAEWLIVNYGYSHPNTTVDLSRIPSVLIKVLELNDPSAGAAPPNYIDKYVPRRSLYNQTWEEVKAA